MTGVRRKITVESAEAVLWFAARGDGLFAEEGLEVEIIKSPAPPKWSWDDPRVRDHRLVPSFNYQTFFEDRKCDIMRACEWGQIRRAYDSKRGAPIVGKRPAVVCQGIYVRPESPVNAPIQLANVPVGVHAGPVEERYAALEHQRE